MCVCALCRLAVGVKAQAFDEDLCHQGAVQCDKAGHITDLVLQGTDMETDLSCPSFSAGFAQLPKMQRLDLAGAKLGRCLEACMGKHRASGGQLVWTSTVCDCARQAEHMQAIQGRCLPVSLCEAQLTLVVTRCEV